MNINHPNKILFESLFDEFHLLLLIIENEQTKSLFNLATVLVNFLTGFSCNTLLGRMFCLISKFNEFLFFRQVHLYLK